MGINEQREEREVLASIFPDEITDVSESEFRVSITLDTFDDEDTDGDTDGDAPKLILTVRYHSNYPDEAPELAISAASHTAPKSKYLDVQEDNLRLLDSLQPVIKENLGMAMVFTLVSTLKESAEMLISQRREEVEATRVAEASRAEEEENRRFHGTQVNRETFFQWRDAFQKEMAQLDRKRQEEKELEDKRKKTWKEDKKLTGRELWEKGLVGKADEEDVEEDVPLTLEKLKLSA